MFAVPVVGSVAVAVAVVLVVAPVVLPVAVVVVVARVSAAVRPFAVSAVLPIHETPFLVVV